MKITNLTNSPHNLLNDKGEKVHLAARGTIEGFTPHQNHAALYKSIGYFRIEEDAAPKVVEQDLSDASTNDLREKYEAISGKSADKRWNDKRLIEEIEKASKD